MNTSTDAAQTRAAQPRTGDAGRTRHGSELPEILDRLQRHGRFAQGFVLLADGLHTGQMQQRIEQHRCVARREDEAVAIGPDRILRVEPQKVLPQAIGDGRQGHRCARVPGIGRLHGVHGKGADGIDTRRIEIAVACHSRGLSKTNSTHFNPMLEALHTRTEINNQ